jgi:hypothetical protein
MIPLQVTVVRTTVRLDERLMRKAKVLAAREGITFTALIEDSLRQRIARSGQPQESGQSLPVSGRTGGLRPGLDPGVLTDNRKLADLLDGLHGPS